MCLFGCKELMNFINLLGLGRDGRHTNVAIDMWLRDFRFLCEAFVLLQTKTSSYLCPAEHRPPAALDGLGKKVRKEKKTWFCCVPAWASCCAGHLTSIVLFKLHTNPKTISSPSSFLQIKRQRPGEVP